MNYISSDENRIMLEVDALVHEKKKDFAIIKTIDTYTNQGVYDLFELTGKEVTYDFSNETLESFQEKFGTAKMKNGYPVKLVKIFQNGEVANEIGSLISVLVFEPNQSSYEKEIHKTRTAYKKIVDGDTEFVSINNGEYILVCNEVGMLIDLPLNRGFHGTFFIAKNVDGYCDSLNTEDKLLLKKEFEGKQNFESKSKYLQEYFQSNPVERRVFTYSNKDTNFYVGTESIIAFLLEQNEKEALQITELEIRDIEREGKDIYKYLEQIGTKLSTNL